MTIITEGLKRLTDFSHYTSCIRQLILLLIIELRVCSRPQCLHVGTHAGVLLEFVQEVLGRNEVIQEVPKTVVLIGRLQDWEDLDDKYAKRREKTVKAVVYGALDD